jgi:ribosome assembly protein YihI (activator of Der GTPase)
MPSKTPKQKRTMAAAAHDPKFAAKVGIPVQVAKEFNRADTGRKILTVKHKTK